MDDASELEIVTRQALAGINKSAQAKKALEILLSEFRPVFRIEGKEVCFAPNDSEQPLDESFLKQFDELSKIFSFKFEKERNWLKVSGDAIYLRALDFFVSIASLESFQRSEKNFKLQTAPGGVIVGTVKYYMHEFADDLTKLY